MGDERQVCRTRYIAIRIAALSRFFLGFDRVPENCLQRHSVMHESSYILDLSKRARTLIKPTREENSASFYCFRHFFSDNSSSYQDGTNNLCFSFSLPHSSLVSFSHTLFGHLPNLCFLCSRSVKEILVILCHLSLP